MKKRPISKTQAKLSGETQTAARVVDRLVARDLLQRLDADLPAFQTVDPLYEVQPLTEGELLARIRRGEAVVLHRAVLRAVIKAIA